MIEYIHVSLNIIEMFATGVVLYKHASAIDSITIQEYENYNTHVTVTRFHFQQKHRPHKS